MRQVRRRRDPAPTRIAYRLRRLWLKPGIRALVLKGMPLAGIVAMAVLLISAPDNRAWIAEKITAAQDYVISHPEFAVSGLAVHGTSPSIVHEVQRRTVVEFPTSSLTLDLATLRAEIEQIPAIDRAELSIGQDDLLHVHVTERVPAALWRLHGELYVIDAEGVEIALLEQRGMQPDLPLVLGEGAATALHEALVLYRNAGPLTPRIRGLVRVGERRWDMVLSDGQRIMLPPSGALAALLHAVALHMSDDVMSRELVHLDMRQAGQPIIRLSPRGVEALRHLRIQIEGEDA